MIAMGVSPQELDCRCLVTFPNLSSYRKPESPSPRSWPAHGDLAGLIGLRSTSSGLVLLGTGYDHAVRLCCAYGTIVRLV
jgi:hypothetical protein